MKPIKIYKNDRFGEIRTMTTDSGISLFCLNDVCHILEIGSVAMAKSTLNPEGIVTTMGVVNILKRAFPEAGIDCTVTVSMSDTETATT